jgi:predicted nucleotidyltransferase
MSNEVTSELLNEVVRRIVEIAHPRRIILFGSAARGQMGPNSDLDILVVMPDGIHRRQTAQTLYRNLPAMGIGKDIIVVTESDVRDYGQNPSLVLCPALREGKEVYVA